MKVMEMTRKDFESLPSREWDEDVGVFTSLVILPQKGTHDSGYRLMDFVAVKNGEAVCRLSGCSDVLHFDGIAGFGKDWVSRYGKCPDKVPPSGWSMDCLPKSGLLNIWPSSNKMSCNPALSSFEIFAEEGKQ